jgi:hypothetical protein
MRAEIKSGSNCGGLVPGVLGDVGAGTEAGAMYLLGGREAGAVGGVNAASEGRRSEA